jgi:Putative auto-transporter adhesin, head GIN domain
MTRYAIRHPLFIAVLALALMGSSIACSFFGWRVVRGSGKVVEEEREVAGFTGVVLNGIGHLIIARGDTERLRIEAEDNLLPYIEAQVSGGVLEIGPRTNANLWPRRPVNYYLTVIGLESVTVSGSGQVEAPALEADQFDLTISGSGDAKIDGIDTQELIVRISGSGKVEIAGGKADKQDLSISGSGKYTARELESVDAQVRISGSGAAVIRVSETLDVNVSGSGNVQYVGRPRIQQTVSGSGKVRAIEE